MGKTKGKKNKRLRADGTPTPGRLKEDPGYPWRNKSDFDPETLPKAEKSKKGEKKPSEAASDCSL